MRRRTARGEKGPPPGGLQQRFYQKNNNPRFLPTTLWALTNGLFSQLLQTCSASHHSCRLLSSHTVLLHVLMSIITSY
jgi:hypothetical protein